MRTLVCTIAIAILGLACRGRSDRASEARQDVAEEQKELAQTERDVAKDTAEEQRAGAKDIQDQREDLTQAQREAAATAGQPVTVQGTVKSVSSDEFALKTRDGEDIDLNFDKSTMGQNAQPFTKDSITEGSEVRATYTVRDGDNYVQRIEVVQPGQLHK